MNVSRETMARLETYAALLKKWNPAINLVAKSTLDDLWERHFEDSAQVFDLCPDGASAWVDLGSGGGFPGMVVAILAAEARPTTRVMSVSVAREEHRLEEHHARAPNRWSAAK